jgi:hypothetical protein
MAESEEFQFCIGNKISLNTYTSVNLLGSSEKKKSDELKSPIHIADSPLSREDIETIILKFRQSLAGRSDGEIKSLKRAINWWARNGVDKTDRFINLWIALEVLINLNGNGGVYRSKNSKSPC